MARDNATWDEMTQDPPEQQTPVSTPPKEVPAVTEATPPAAEEASINPPGYGRPIGEEVVESDRSVSGPRYKVEPPRTAFEWNGVKVTDEWTVVPRESVGPLLSAAQDVGVELTVEEV